MSSNIVESVLGTVIFVFAANIPYDLPTKDVDATVPSFIISIFLSPYNGAAPNKFTPYIPTPAELIFIVPVFSISEPFPPNNAIDLSPETAIVPELYISP